MRDNAKGGALTEVTFFILLSLYEPKHGYAIMQYIESETNGRLVLGAGSLYGALETLTQKAWIEPVESEDSRKKQYRITELGQQIVQAETKRLKAIVSIAVRLTGGMNA